MEQIVSTPGVLGGTPRLAGTRIPAAMVWSLVADGMSAAEIAAFYPSVTPEHVEALRGRHDLHCEGHGGPGRWYCCRHPHSGWPCPETP